MAAREHGRLSEEGVNQVSQRLAQWLHENWRNGYIATHRTGDGPDDFEPRWKSVGNDYTWLNAAKESAEYEKTLRYNQERGEYEVDIARVPFESLPNNPWIIDNWTAATQVVALIHHAIIVERPINVAFLEDAAAEVHRMWQYRHPEVRERGKDEAEERMRAIQRLAYEDPNFTEVERNKDREHVVLALKLYGEVYKEFQTPTPKPTPWRNAIRRAIQRSHASLFREQGATMVSAKEGDEEGSTYETLYQDAVGLTSAIAEKVAA
jgi:hypothetical protein